MAHPIVIKDGRFWHELPDGGLKPVRHPGARGVTFDAMDSRSSARRAARQALKDRGDG